MLRIFLFLLVFLYLSSGVSAFTTNTLSDGTVAGCFDPTHRSCSLGGVVLSADSNPAQYTILQCANYQCPGSTVDCLFYWDSNSGGCYSLNCVFSPSAQVDCDSSGHSTAGTYFIVSAPTASPAPTTSTTTTTTPAALSPYITCAKTDSQASNLASVAVTNPNACWNFCYNTQGCLGATIYGGICYAKSSTLLNVISAAPPTTLLLPSGYTCPLPYVSCSGLDSVSSNLAQQTNTPDASTCWYFCQNTAGCVGATISGGTCYAKGSILFTNTITASSSTTVLLPLGYSCPAVGGVPIKVYTICSGFDVTGDIASSAAIASINTLAGCWNFCQSTAGCTTVILGGGRCYAKNSQALNAIVTASSSSSLLVSGKFSCPSLGNAIEPAATSGTTASLQCAPLSFGIFTDTWTGVCTFLYGYEFPVGGTVSMFSIEIQAVTGTPIYLGVFSSPLGADPTNTTYTVVGGALYTPVTRGNVNVTLSSPITVTAGHVLGHCAQNGQPGQMGWTAVTASGAVPNAAQISLTNGPIPMTAFSVGTSFSTSSGQYSPVTITRFYLMAAYYTRSDTHSLDGLGYQACQSYIACTGNNLGVNGFDLGSVGSINSEAACWALCQATTGCVFAVWYAPGGICFPKTQGGLFAASVAVNGQELILPTQYACVNTLGNSIATPPPHAVVTQATYLGCYFDNGGTPLLPLSSTAANGGYTAATCQAFALANNAKYFGVEKGGTCIYGNVLSSSSTSNHCYIQCTADLTHSCGGPDSADVYQATPLPVPSQFRISVGAAQNQGLITYVIPITPGVTTYTQNACRDPSMVTIQDSFQVLTEYNTSTLLLSFPVETITQSGIGTLGVAAFAPGNSETHVVGALCATAACATGVNVARTRGQTISFSLFNSLSATAPPVVITEIVPDGAGSTTTYTITLSTGVCSVPMMFEFLQSQTYSNTNEGSLCNGAVYTTTILGNRFVTSPLSECSSLTAYPVDFCVRLVVPDVLPGSSPPCPITSAGYTVAETLSVYSTGVQPEFIFEYWLDSSGSVLSQDTLPRSANNAYVPTHRLGSPPTSQLQIGQTYYLFWDTSVMAFAGTGARIQAGHKHTVAVSVIAGSTSQLVLPPSLTLQTGNYYSFSKDCEAPSSGVNRTSAYHPTPEGAFLLAVINSFSSVPLFKLSILNQTTVGGYDIINSVVYFPLSNQILTWTVQGGVTIAIPTTALAVGVAPSAAQITTFFSAANGFSASIWKMSIYQPVPSALNPALYAQSANGYGIGFGLPEIEVVYLTPINPVWDPTGCHDFQFRAAASTAPVALPEGSITFTGVTKAPGLITTATSSGVVSGGTMNLCRPAPLSTETVQFSAVFGNAPTFSYLGYTLVITQGGTQIGSRSVTFSTPKTDSVTITDTAIVYSYSSQTPLVVTWTFFGPLNIPFVSTFKVSIGACAGLQGFYVQRVGGGMFPIPFIGQLTATNTYTVDMYSGPLTPNGVYRQVVASFVPGLPIPSVITEVTDTGSSSTPAPCNGCDQPYFTDRALFGSLGLNGVGVQFTTSYSASSTPIALNAYTWTIGVGPTAIVYTININLHIVNQTQIPNNVKPLAMNTGTFVSGTYGLGTSCFQDLTDGVTIAVNPILGGDGRLLWGLYNNYTSQGFLVQAISTPLNITVSGTSYYTINASVTHVLSGLALTWFPPTQTDLIAQYWSSISLFLPAISGNPINQTTTFWSSNPASGQWYMTPGGTAFDPTNTANIQGVAYGNEFIYPTGGLTCYVEFFAYTANPIQVAAGGAVGRPSYFQAILWNQANTAGGQLKTTPFIAVSSGQTSFQLNLCSLTAQSLSSVQLQATFPSVALLPYTISETVQQAGNPSLFHQSNLNTAPPASGGSTLSGVFVKWYSLSLSCGSNDLVITWIIEETISGGGFQQETFTISIHVGPCRAPDYFFAQGTDNMGVAFPAFLSVPSSGLLNVNSVCQPQAQSSGSTTISVSIDSCVDAATGRTSNPFNSNLTVQVVAFFATATSRWPSAITETVSPILTPVTFLPVTKPVAVPSLSLPLMNMPGTSYTYSQLGLSSGSQTAYIQFLWDATIDLGFTYQITVNHIGFCQVPTTTTTTTTTTTPTTIPPTTILGASTVTTPTTSTVTTSTVTTSTTTTAFPVSTAVGSTNHIVVVSDFALTPQHLSIVPGDSVTWTLAQGSSIHGVSSTTAAGGCTFSQSSAAVVNSPVLTASSYTNVFIVEGLYPYASPFDCSSYASMRGTISVQSLSATTAGPTTTQVPATTAAVTTTVAATPAAASSLSTGAISGIAAGGAAVCLGVVGFVGLYAAGVIGSAGSAAGGGAAAAAAIAVAGEDVGLFSADENRLF